MTHDIFTTPVRRYRSLPRREGRWGMTKLDELRKLLQEATEDRLDEDANFRYDFAVAMAALGPGLLAVVEAARSAEFKWSSDSRQWLRETLEDFESDEPAGGG